VADSLEARGYATPLSPRGRPGPDAGPWCVLIVDDDPSVHDVTRMMLGRFSFEGRPLRLIHAYSGAEARAAVLEHPEIAMVLLDVVMEEDDTGLKLVKFIREEAGNLLARIVLRTGQPGRAPERKVIIDYDINDYKLKTELTADRLFITMVSTLRSYHDLLSLDRNRVGLERVIESSRRLFRNQPFEDFMGGALVQIASVLGVGADSGPSGLSVARGSGGDSVNAAVGLYAGSVGRKPAEVLDGEALALIEEAFSGEGIVVRNGRFAARFGIEGCIQCALLVECGAPVGPWDRRLIELLRANIAVAMDNICLNREIENSQREIIFTLGEVAEARSSETGHHVKRVSERSKVLAIRAGLSEAEAAEIRLASSMHDIGKLAIPDAILNKPGPLSEEEFAVIRTHPVAGHEMLRNSGRRLMKKAAEIALEHQERYDGSGYPYGKKGEEIGIAGRIVAIADVFDALGCDRVYKSAWEAERIVEYFMAERGRQFDPALVDLFLSDLGPIARIKDRFPE